MDNQIYENNLIGYSDTIDNRTYSIGITFFTENIVLSKQNILNAIIQNSGTIMLEQTLANRHTVTVAIPKNNTIPFMENIKGLGVIADESKGLYADGGYYAHFEERLKNARYKLEEYNALSTEADTIADKIKLAEEIVEKEREIAMLEKSIKEMELRHEYNNVSIEIYKQ